MPIFTKRWNDPAAAKDGTCILITRYRPRGLPKSKETWTEWIADLSPSKPLLADVYGKNGPPLAWGKFRTSYLREMAGQKDRIAELAKRVSGGKTITLLCSTHCVDETKCHRTLLKQLIEKQVKRAQS